MTDETADLLERVFAELSSIENDPAALLARLAGDRPEARVIGVLRALLLADASIRATFALPPDGLSEADLARSAATLLVETADDAERAEAPGRPMRLSELSLA